MMGLMVLAFYATYRISLVASQLASPPRLRRPSSFGNVQLGNPSLASINLQSLSLASFALVIQLIRSARFDATNQLKRRWRH